MWLSKMFEERKRIVDKELDEFLDSNGTTLAKAMRYSLFAGGKRLRPLLAWLSYEACGGRDKEEILPFAGALELAHTATLIHDDLPSMDNDELRRGKPTSHRVFGEAMAILAGDALILAALEMALRSKAPPKRVVESASLLSQAIGFRGVIKGQELDLFTRELNPKSLRNIHKHKTAIFIAACMEGGALLAGCPKKKREKIKKAGIYLGMAFQIQDDILDAIGNEKKLGKKARKDKGKPTYTEVYGVERSIRIRDGYCRRAKRIFEELGENWRVFKKITDFIARRDH